ncbi:hypothetical protein K4039_12885 [Lyngbya sp. CCAP 1446/10]|uniref:hypothetical protein n=1 Tax=Microcoleaceae TaxID=1892252 RepID=UPI00223770D9|nr:hypothetical protein [Lyngbya sp. CCAP 1446/10]MCW6050959.1 hypothetical protein [Lyngbya sp. CCAP 1446/10]
MNKKGDRLCYGRRKKEEGRGKKEEGRRERGEGKIAKLPIINYLDIIPSILIFAIANE